MIEYNPANVSVDTPPPPAQPVVMQLSKEPAPPQDDGKKSRKWLTAIVGSGAGFLTITSVFFIALADIGATCQLHEATAKMVCGGGTADTALKLGFTADVWTYCALLFLSFSVGIYGGWNLVEKALLLRKEKKGIMTTSILITIVGVLAMAASAVGGVIWWRNRDHVIQLALAHRARDLQKVKEVKREAAETAARKIHEDEITAFEDVESRAIDHDINDALDLFRGPTPGGNGTTDPEAY